MNKKKAGAVPLSSRGPDRLQLAPEWLLRIAEQAGEGIAVADPKGRLIFVNAAWAKMHGYKISELLGKNISVGHNARQMKDDVTPFNKKVMKLGKWSGPVGHVRKDGTAFMTEMTTTILRGPGRKVVGIIGFARDISDRLRAEGEAAKSRQKYQTLANIAPAGIFHTTPDGHTTYINPQWYKITGLSRKSAMGLGWMDALHPDDRKRIEAGWRKAVRGKAPSSTTCRFLRRDGGVRWVVGQALPERDHAGRLVGYVGTITDITDWKQAEQKLQQCLDFNRSIISRSPIGIAVRDKHGRLESYNKAWERIWALPKLMIEEMKQAMTPDLLQSMYSYVPDHLPGIIKVFRHGGTYYIPEINIQNLRPGQAAWIRQLFYTVRDGRGGVEKIIVMVEDITERKTAEKELCESEARYRLLVKHAPAGIYEFNYRTGKIVGVNDVMCQYTGYSREEILAMNPMDLLDGESQAVHLQRLGQARAEDTIPDTVEYKIRCKDGSTIWCLVFSRYVFESDKLVGATAVAHNITERKQAEESLKYYQGMFNLLLEHSPVHVFFKDQNIRPVMLSKNYEQMLGRPLAEILGKTMNELFPSALAENMIEDDKRILREGKLVETEEELGGRIYNTIKFPIQQEGRPPMLAGFTMDITEQKRACQSLRDEKNKLVQLFDISLTVARAGTIQEMLDRTMSGLADLELFGRMVMIVKDEHGRNEHLSHIGLSDGDQAMIREAPPAPPQALKSMLDKEHRISNSYHLPFDERRPQQLLSLTRPKNAPSGGDWRSGDCLAIPLTAKSGTIGYLAVFDPLDGKVPSVEAVRLLELYANQAATAIDNLRLYEDLEVSYYDTLRAFVAAMEAKDPYTKGHSENVQSYAVRLAQHLGLPGDRVRLIDYSALLHDIGKLGIRESILGKPTSLSEAEYEEVKQHPLVGSQMVTRIENLATSAPIIHAHHEFYDGTGYPEGIGDEQIPLESRIISVADAFEAMTSDRPYRKAFTGEEAIRRLQEASGGQFDKSIVDAFVEMFRQKSSEQQESKTTS